jgi:hypothetical protein
LLSLKLWFLQDYSCLTLLYSLSSNNQLNWNGNFFFFRGWAWFETLTDTDYSHSKLELSRNRPWMPVCVLRVRYKYYLHAKNKAISETGLGGPHVCFLWGTNTI